MRRLLTPKKLRSLLTSLILFVATSTVFLFITDYVFLKYEKNVLSKKISISENIDLPANGYNDRLRSLKKEKNIFRILSFGDSFTFGTVMPPYTYSSYLEKILNENTKQKVEVINLGWPGTQLDQYVERILFWTSKFEFDAVVLNLYLGNDLWGTESTFRSLETIKRQINSGELSLIAGLPSLIPKKQYFRFLDYLYAYYLMFRNSSGASENEFKINTIAKIHYPEIKPHSNPDLVVRDWKKIKNISSEALRKPKDYYTIISGLAVENSQWPLIQFTTTINYIPEYFIDRHPLLQQKTSEEDKLFWLKAIFKLLNDFEKSGKKTAMLVAHPQAFYDEDQMNIALDFMKSWHGSTKLPLVTLEKYLPSNILNKFSMHFNYQGIFLDSIKCFSRYKDRNLFVGTHWSVEGNEAYARIIADQLLGKKWLKGKNSELSRCKKDDFLLEDSDKADEIFSRILYIIDNSLN